MNKVGEVEGNTVYYDLESNTVKCKDQIIPYVKLLGAIYGNLDRVRLTDKMICSYNETVEIYTIGCLRITKGVIEEINNKIIQIKNKNNAVN